MNKLDHDLFVAGPGGQMEVTWRNILGYIVFFGVPYLITAWIIWTMAY